MQCMMFTFDAKCQPCFALSIIYTGISTKKRDEDDRDEVIKEVLIAIQHTVHKQQGVYFARESK